MDRNRERIDLKLVERQYGGIAKVKSVVVRQLFREGTWSELIRPLSLEDAADSDATSYGLMVTTEDGREFFPDFRREEVVKPRFDPNKPRTYIRGRMMLQFLDDPETPLIVSYRYGNHRSEVTTGTFHCVIENGFDYHELTLEEAVWLESFWSEADAWYESRRVLA